MRQFEGSEGIGFISLYSHALTYPLTEALRDSIELFFQIIVKLDRIISK